MRLFTVILVLTLSWFSLSAKPLATDTSAVDLRVPAESRLKSYQNNPDYSYGIESNPSFNYWSELWRQIISWIDNFFSDEAYGSTRQALAYLFVALVVVFIVLKMVGVDFTRLFVKKAASTGILHDILGNNIQSTDFETLIARSVAERDYRFAVRLYYLSTLKHLSEKGLISWELNKTNRSYTFEVQPEHRPAFEYLTRQFEYVWYGDFTVFEGYYLKLKAEFDSFISKL